MTSRSGSVVRDVGSTPRRRGRRWSCLAVSVAMASAGVVSTVALSATSASASSTISATPCTLFGATVPPIPDSGPDRRGGAGGQVHRERGRIGDGCSLLQGHWEHGPTHRNPLDRRRIAAGHRDVHRRDRYRLAGSHVCVAGRGYRGHHVCRLVPHDRWSLCLHAERVLVGVRQPAAARAGRRRSRREWRLRVRSGRIPGQHVQCRELLGRRAVHDHCPTRRQSIRLRPRVLPRSASRSRREPTTGTRSRATPPRASR